MVVGLGGPPVSCLCLVFFLLCFVPLFKFIGSIFCFSPLLSASLSIFPFFVCLHPSSHPQIPDHLWDIWKHLSHWISLLWLHPFPLDGHTPSPKLWDPSGSLTYFPSSPSGCKCPPPDQGTCGADGSILPLPLPTGQGRVRATQGSESPLSGSRLPILVASGSPAHLEMG